jgi:hypothetical protein
MQANSPTSSFPEGGAERMVPPPSQAAMGSRQTSENELKVRAIDVGESLKSPPTELIKRYK